MTIESARKSDTVERTVAHDEDIRDERKQLRMNLAETWRTRDSGGIYAVNPDMPRIEPFVRINEGLPGGNDNPGSNAHKPELANAGTISIRGLNIKRNERRKRSSTRHRKKILTIRGQERAGGHEDRRSGTQREPGLPPPGTRCSRQRSRWTGDDRDALKLLASASMGSNTLPCANIAVHRRKSGHAHAVYTLRRPVVRA